jgi:hypothetical protein
VCLDDVRLPDDAQIGAEARKLKHMSGENNDIWDDLREKMAFDAGTLANISYTMLLNSDYF